MPSVNLSALVPFDKNKNIWIHFYKENILGNLMANGLDAAVLTDNVPDPPIPALSNSLQDQRDHVSRVEKYNDETKKLTEKLSIAYAIVCKLITVPQTRTLVRLADDSVPDNFPYRLRLVIRNMITAMKQKYANNQLSDNAALIGKWISFRWSFRYGFNPTTAADPTDCGYSRIEDFSNDYQTAVEEYSVYDPETTNNQVGLQQTLLQKLHEYPGILEAIKLAACPDATDLSILQMLIRQEALGLHATRDRKTVTAALKNKSPQKLVPGQGANKKTCYNCDKDGHFARDCRNKFCKKCDAVLVMWYCHHIIEGQCKNIGVKRVAAVSVDVKEEAEEEEEDDSTSYYNTFSTGNLFNQIQDYIALIFSYVLDCVLWPLTGISDRNITKKIPPIWVFFPPIWVYFFLYLGYFILQVHALHMLYLLIASTTIVFGFLLVCSCRDQKYRNFRVAVVRTVASITTQNDTFLLDSGADISVQNGVTSLAIREGTTVAVQGINGKSTSSRYVDVGEFSLLYMPEASESIISVRDVVNRGHTVTFNPQSVFITDKNGEVVIQKENNGLCFLSNEEVKILRTKTIITETVKTQCMRIHLRQGHASSEAMCRAIDSGAWINADITSTQIRAVFRYDPGIDCAIAKMRRGKRGASDGVYPRIGSIISFDWISCSTISLNGDVGFFYMVDIGTGAIYAYPSKTKSAKEFKRILTHHLLLMTQAGHIVTTIHSDMGTTETSTEIRDVLRQLGIKAEECNIRRQENNTVESYVQVCTRGVAAILLALPWHNPSLWPYALVHFCDVNRTIPNFKSGDKSPAQILYNKVVNCIRNFNYPYGTIVVCVFDKNSKFGRRDTFENGLVGFVAGYNHDKINDDGIIVFVPSFKTTEIFKHSDVRPLTGPIQEQLKRLNIVALGNPVQVDVPPGSQRQLDLTHIQRTVDREREILRERESVLQEIRRQEQEDDVRITSLRVTHATQGRECRIALSKRTRTTDDNPSLRKIMTNTDLFEIWRDALLSEINGLESESLEFVEQREIPKDADVYDSMMVTTTKRSKRDNTIERRKCRLVVRGDQQTKLLIENIFAPTVSRQSFILLIILAVQFNLVIVGFDVTQAFLNSAIDGTVYIRLPYDLFNNGNMLNIKSKFALLKRSVYGLKEAPRLWYDNISQTLANIGFTRKVSDICMYQRGSIQENNLILIALTVDDGAIAASTKELADEIFAYLEKQYTITKQEELTSYAGFTVDKFEGGYKVSQPGYIANLPSYIHEDYMDCYNSIRTYGTPIDEKIFTDIEVDIRQPTETEYKSLIGAIIYTLPTQPGISFAVSILASRAQTHTTSDYVRLLRLVKYLFFQDDGIIIKWSSNFVLNAFCDASWNIDPETSMSYYCYIIRLGDNILAMTSKKIKTIMLSSTEAEQYSMLELCKQIIFWRHFLEEILMTTIKGPTPIYQDNQSAITICKSIDKNFKKVKYFLMRINKVNELIQDNVVEPIWIHTDYQLADIGTKPTSPAKYHFLNDRICGNELAILSNPIDLEDDM